MAELAPILPLLYNPDIVGDLSSVITPPYDVISPDEQEAYRARSPYSAIHIELPTAEGIMDPYRHAASLIRSWVSVGVLDTFTPESFFVHRQDFEVAGTPYSRTALIAGVKLEEWSAGVVIPHERTHAGPKRDRLELFRATSIAPSTIFGLYDSSPSISQAVAVATSRQPLGVAEQDGVHHRLWAMNDSESMGEIAREMRKRHVYIADGHHRYETSLAYRDEMREGSTDSPDCSYNYVAMSLVAFDDPGLVVLPTHRLVSGASDERAAALASLDTPGFRIEVLNEWETSETWADRALQVDAPYAYLFYMGGEVLRITADERVLPLLPPDRSDAWKHLELAVLHSVILERELGISSEDTERCLEYTRDVPGAFESVQRGGSQVACFVRPTSVQQLRAVADAGDKMPEKSTYFYPKFPAGLVYNQLNVKLTGIAE